MFFENEKKRKKKKEKEKVKKKIKVLVSKLLIAKNYQEKALGFIGKKEKEKPRCRKEEKPRRRPSASSFVRDP